MQNTGLVLGGGGARGIAHLGVAKALYEAGIKPSVISGVSAGSIAGAMLAANLEPLKIFEIIKSLGFFKFSKIIIPKTGLFALKGLEEMLKKEIPFENIEDLPVELWIAVSNISTGKVEYYNKGPLDKIVMASSSIPVIFEPVKMNGDLYVDGGLFDNLPVEPLKDKCDTLIAVSLTPNKGTVKLDNMFQIAMRTFHLSVEANTRNNRKFCDIIIEPDKLNRFDILQVKDAEKLFELGYEEAKKQIQKILV